MQYCYIDNDKWDYHGIKFLVLSQTLHSDSTAIELVLQNTNNGAVETITVATNQVGWL
jgi:hypothetical protein